MATPDPPRLDDGKLPDFTTNPILDWANSGTRVAPPTPKVDQGFILSERPPHEWFNYLINQQQANAQNAQWLQAITSIANIRYSPTMPPSVFPQDPLITWCPERGIWGVYLDVGNPHLFFYSQQGDNGLAFPIEREVIDWTSITPAATYNNHWQPKQQSVILPPWRPSFLVNTLNAFVIGGTDCYVARAVPTPGVWSLPTTDVRSLAFDPDLSNLFCAAGGRYGTVHNNTVVAAGSGDFYSTANTLFIVYSTDNGNNWLAVPTVNLPASYANSSAISMQYDPFRERFFLMTSYIGNPDEIWWADDPSGTWTKAIKPSTFNQFGNMFVTRDLIMVNGYGATVTTNQSNVLVSTDGGLNFTDPVIESAFWGRHGVAYVNGIWVLLHGGPGSDPVIGGVSFDQGKRWNWDGVKITGESAWNSGGGECNQLRGNRFAVGYGQIAYMCDHGIAYTDQLPFSESMAFPGYNNGMAFVPDP